MDNGSLETHRFYRIAKVEDIPEGERVFFELEKQPIVLFSIKGQFLATGDVCTHDMGSIGEGEIIGDEIVCPRHGARFNMKTGEVMSFPAVTGIPVYPVRIIDGHIEVGVEKNS